MKTKQDITFNYEREDASLSVLGDNLRAIRTALGLTQKTVATHAGLSTESLSLWERGSVSPSVDNLVSLLDFYGFLTGDEFNIYELVAIPSPASVRGVQPVVEEA